MNLIRNNTVTTEDIQLAEKTYGSDLGGIKSKSTRSNPLPVKNQVITMPDDLLQVNEEITLGVVNCTLLFQKKVAHSRDLSNNY